MSNPSRIAMLAQLREATGDDIRAADHARDGSKDGSTVWQEQMLQRACRADETLTCLILGQKPTTERDMLSLMVAITGVTDLLLDAAAGEPNAAELRRLTELVEQAAGNAALYLCQSAEPYTPQEQRAVRSLRARFDMSDASTGEEA